MWFVFCMPNVLGHSDNWIKANALVTPVHIVPEWYFLSFYALLRALPNKLNGVLLLLSSLLILMLIPFFFKPLLKSTIYDEIYVILPSFLFICFFWLTFLGGKPIEDPYYTYSRYFSSLFFCYFIVIVYYIKLFRKSTWLIYNSYGNFRI